MCSHDEERFLWKQRAFLVFKGDICVEVLFVEGRPFDTSMGRYKCMIVCMLVMEYVILCL